MGLEWAVGEKMVRDRLASEILAVYQGQTSETADAPILPAVVADS